MLHHLFKKHPLIHAEIIRTNSSSKMRKAEGAVVKESAASSSGSGSGGASKEPPKPHHPSSLGSALAQLRACSLAGGGGGGSAFPSPPMSAEDCLPHDRRFVLMCALQTLDPGSLCSDLGHRLFVGGLAPGYGAGRRLARRRNGLAPSGSSYAASTAVTEGENGARAAGTANAILQDLCAGVRREVASALRAHSESCRRLGWSGPFVGLQVDSTGLPGGEGGGGGGGGGEEVCTASVSFVSEDFGGLVRLAIGARCFRGRQTSHAKETWIRELTADLFTSICHKSEPKDIYLAATVGGCSGGGGGGGGSSFGRAFQDMGVPVLVCSSYRLHSAVSCSLGCATAGGAGEDKCANTKMRDVVRRAVSMVEVFEHWRPEGGVFAAAAAAAPGSGSGSATTLETARVEVEELAAALARARGSNTRRVVVGCAGVSAVWTDSHALFERLLQLAGPLNAHFRQAPTDRSLQPSEWQAIREAASILEPALEVLAKVHAREEGEWEGEMEGEEGRRAAEGVGTSAAAAAACNGGDRGAAGAAARDKKKPRGIFLAESIELHANLHCSFIYPLQDIRGDALATAATGEGVAAAPAMVAAGAGAGAAPFCSKRVAELTPEAQALLEAVAEGMEESGLGRAREDTEAVSMLLDPRFKQCCASTCVDGGSALKLRALKAISSQLRKFRDPASEAGGGQGGAGDGGGGAAAARQEPGAAAAAAAGGGAAVSRLDKMRQAQKMEAAAAGATGAAGGLLAPPPGENGTGGAGGGGDGGGFPGEVDNRLSEDARAELEEYLLEPASKRHELLSYWRLHGTDTLDSGTGEVVLAARWPHLALVARLYAGIDSTSREGERHFGGGSGGGAELGAAVRSLQRGGMPPWRIEQMLLVRLNRHVVPEVVDFLRGGC
ncbi:unnamed protein product [Ectocarpus sp. 6 AP-2014]